MQLIYIKINNISTKILKKIIFEANGLIKQTNETRNIAFTHILTSPKYEKSKIKLLLEYLIIKRGPEKTSLCDDLLNKIKEIEDELNKFYPAN